MKIAMFDVHRFDQKVFTPIAESFGVHFDYFETRLNMETVKLTKGYKVLCCFVNDNLDENVLAELAGGSVELIALRCAGFDNVDVECANRLGIKVVRVPKYSPYSVAEHAVALILCLLRKIHKSYNRVRDHNFSLEGLVGREIHGKTVGVVGTGKIGSTFVKIMNGFGCKILAFDLFKDPTLVEKYECSYVGLDELLNKADIVSLHLPLTSVTKHILNEKTMSNLKGGVTLINTGRGGLIDTCALLRKLESGTIGAAGLDVYEDESRFFFQDLSESIISDDCLVRLLSFPNVIMTSHQAFLTHEALSNIANTTIENIKDFEVGRPLKNQI